jgi:hypothetical protein
MSVVCTPRDLNSLTSSSRLKAVGFCHSPRDGAIFQQAVTPRETEFTNQVHKIALGHFGGDVTDFDPTWKNFLLEFQQWSTQTSAQNVSTLHLRLAFLADASYTLSLIERFANSPRIMDLVLTGCRMIGDQVVDPRFGECEIVERSIGDGSLVSFEFFD